MMTCTVLRSSLLPHGTLHTVWVMMAIGRICSGLCILERYMFSLFFLCFCYSFLRDLVDTFGTPGYFSPELLGVGFDRDNAPGYGKPTDL